MTLARISRFGPLALLALFATSCAVPLGPGFHTEKELLEVRFVPGSPPHLEVRATYRLKNSGNAPLDALDISLPDEKDFGRQNLRITVDGAAVSPQSLASNAPDAATTRIAFAAPWPQKSKRTLVVSYQLAASSDTERSFGLDASSFVLSTGGWYPQPRAPEGLFARGDAPPLRFIFSVFVPDGFLVHAAGHPQGRKRRAAETEFRFRITADDFSPFVVAGRYHEQQFKDSGRVITFWSLQPLPPDQIQRAAPRLSATAEIFAKLFGPMQARKRSYPLWIVETPFPPPQNSPGTRLAQAGHAPGVALVSSSAFAKTVESEEFLALVERAWASTWTQHVVRPAPGADEFLADALTRYAILVADQARRGEPARLSYASEFLNSYDAACPGNKEIPVALLEQENHGM